MSDTQLTRNFYLSEFTRSQTASRMGREIVVEPDTYVRAQLERLCELVLQPLRDALGPVHITSGYRPEWLNEHIGGAPNSQHTRGEAADIVVTGATPYEVVVWIERSGVPFDQCIHEFGRWCHVSIAPPDRVPRREVLTAWHDPEAGRTQYVAGLRAIDELRAA